MFFLCSALNPFIKFKEINYKFEFLEEFKQIGSLRQPMKYVEDLKNKASKLDILQLDIYFLSKAMVELFEQQVIIKDICSFSIIVYWLLNIDSNFNLSHKLKLDEIWKEKEKYSLEIMSNVMYSSFCGNKDKYMSFANKEKLKIIDYLKKETKSMKLYLNEQGDEIHVEYILLNSEEKNANEESVKRIEIICKTLPIFQTYCADAIRPNVNILSPFKEINNAHKEMPIKNVVVIFHQEFVKLWNNTILSNYECDSVYEWLNGWMTTRKNIVLLFEYSVNIIYKLLEEKHFHSKDLASQSDKLRKQLVYFLAQERRYPHQERPFEEKPAIIQIFEEINIKYFMNIQNYCNQLVGFLKKNEHDTRLAMLNLICANQSLEKMQRFFEKCTFTHNLFIEEHKRICVEEANTINQMIITGYYFIEHKPSKYFDKYIIKKWYDTSYREHMNNVKDSLFELSEYYIVSFAEKYYRDGILKLYPLIVKDLDITECETFFYFLCMCTPIIQFDFNYLIVMLSNSQNQIIGGFRVNMQFLKTLKNILESENEEISNDSLLLCPIQGENNVLKCFSEKFILAVDEFTKYEDITVLFEMLWEYSQYSKYLTTNSDLDYLQELQMNLKGKIFDLLLKCKDKISFYDYSKLVNLYEETIQYNSFDDEKLNRFYEEFVLKT